MVTLDFKDAPFTYVIDHIDNGCVPEWLWCTPDGTCI